MLPRLTWPTCIKHASLGACTYVSTSRLKSYVLQGQQNVYSRPYLYSFRQIFQALRLLAALRLFRSLE